jgi:Holliday junction resolvase RusA-like endonuclease
VVFIQITGTPTAWAPARVCKTHTYSPKFKEMQDAIVQVRAQWYCEPITEAVVMDVDFFLPIPASESKSRKIEMAKGVVPHTKKPDRDNLQKFCSDVLQRAGVISNDSIIVDGRTTKQYGDHPKTIITLKLMETES